MRGSTVYSLSLTKPKTNTNYEKPKADYPSSELVAVLDFLRIYLRVIAGINLSI